MKKQPLTGFATVEALLIVVILSLVGFTGWFVWYSNQQATKSLDNASKSASSKVMKPPKSPLSYLNITAWGVKIPLAMTDIKDAIYSPPMAPPIAYGNSSQIHITTPELQSAATKISGCYSGFDDVYLARGSLSPNTGSHGWTVKIGNYYYYAGSVIEANCGWGTLKSDDQVNQARTTQANLEKALQLVEPN